MFSELSKCFILVNYFKITNNLRFFTFGLFLIFFAFVSTAKSQFQKINVIDSVSSSKIIIEGTVLPKDQHTYILKTFSVPKGIGGLKFKFEYTGQNDYAEMEIGIFDPDRFRGTSRFSKSSFYIGQYRATASYLPGPIIEGEWNISLAFPTIKKKAEYNITVKEIPRNSLEFTGPSKFVLNSSQKWYAGELHTHTGHSDAFGCVDANGGGNIPCQVYRVAKTAERNNLDFVSINDHNTVSQDQDIKVLQPSFPDLLLIRAQEVTTFFGHANVFGTSIPIDFRIGYKDHSVSDIQRKVSSYGALFSINHPIRHSGPKCTGCGWSAKRTDYKLLQALEVVNGTDVGTSRSGIPFWHKLLNEGYKITGIGGSDDHSAGVSKSQPGIPTTMVYAKSLSEKSIIDGIRKGNVYIKTRNSSGPKIKFRAISKYSQYKMGDTVYLNKLEDSSLSLHIQYTDSTEQKLIIIINGKRIKLKPVKVRQHGNFLEKVFSIESPKTGWIRFNLRDNNGITVISNPIYIR